MRVYSRYKQSLILHHGVSSLRTFYLQALRTYCSGLSISKRRKQMLWKELCQRYKNKSFRAKDVNLFVGSRL